MPWTDQEVDQLIELNEKKLSFKQIGKIMGKTRNTIAGKCARLGLKSKSGLAFNPGKIITVTEKEVLRQIVRHTDDFGWGLEMQEILEYTGLPFRVAHEAVDKLLKSRIINKSTSAVAGHIFYNDNSLRQVGV